MEEEGRERASGTADKLRLETACSYFMLLTCYQGGIPAPAPSSQGAAPLFPSFSCVPASSCPFFSHAADIIDPYVPPEGDARLSSLSKDGVTQKMQKLKQTAASQLAYVPPS